MKYPPIFIATPDSREYSALIKEILGSQVEISLASSLEETRLFEKQPVILGRPDFVSELLKEDSPVKWVQSTWAGVTPLIENPNRSYALTSVKGVFGAQMSEYVIGHILSHELKIDERRGFQKNKNWRPIESGQMTGKTAGIMGTGSIGRAVAQSMCGFGVKIIGFNNSGRKSTPFEKVFSQESIIEFLQCVDYLIGVLPETPTTNSLINASTLKHMKKTALIINVGRGNLIDEKALSETLVLKNIAGAVLDVTKHEPLDTGSELWTVPNLKLTAHTAAESRPTDIVGLFLRNLDHFVKDEPLEGSVDFEKGY